MRIEGEHGESESLVINYLHSSNFLGSEGRSAYALARLRRDEGKAAVTSNWWREKEPALTWVKFDLNKNYECNRGNC